MNKLRYTFIFLILISLFPCYGILANEETNNVPSQEITESIEKKNITENVTENESKENHVNIKPQKKENIFIQIMKWLGFIILIAVIAVCIGEVLEKVVEVVLEESGYFRYYDCESIGLIIAIIYFILAIVLKVGFEIGFFWSAIIPIFLFLFLLLFICVWVVWKAGEPERKRKRKEKELEEQRQKAEEQKQKTLEQYQNDAVKQTKANEDAMRKNEVERNIDQLSDYIDMLGVSIQKKELPDVQMVSELSKMQDLIFNNKSYIAKEDFNKIRNDNEVFVKHVLGKCSKLENFSGSLLETRMKQVEAKFDEILK
jgi:Na+-transporting methylmalonyl-CoA/oxaloacetate decarboxylase gamma subunit